MRNLCCFFAIAVLAVPATSDAALTVSLQPSMQTFEAGTATGGFFDVFVTSTGGDEVGTYSIALDILPATSGVTFREHDPENGSFAVTRATSAPQGYIFGNRGSIFPFVTTEHRLEYIDGPNSAPFSTTIAADETYGAGRIFFEVAADATPGTYTFDFDRTVSRFLTPAQTPIATTFIGGSLVITPAAVPEPSTTLLLALTGVVGFAARRYRRKASGATTAA